MILKRAELKRDGGSVGYERLSFISEAGRNPGEA